MSPKTGPGADPAGECDLAVVGGGIVGLAVASELLARRPGLKLTLLEGETRLATRQTTHNSGVVHAGIYYEPGSLKARLCVAGARSMLELCEREGIPHERRGKLIVARERSELPALDELERRARANGVKGLRRVSGGEIAAIEPACVGVAALHSPATEVTDFAAVASVLAARLEERGAVVATSAGVGGVHQARGRIILHHRRGETRARFAVFCAGTGGDRLARLAGAPADPQVVPVRGSYLRLDPARDSLVRGLIYPVPDPRLPFLGVHLTRHVGGEVSLGPTALPLPGRTALRRPGTWRMARRWWRAGATEIRHALSRRALAGAAAAYVPALGPGDFEPWFAGVRAQAVARDGRLVDDFLVHTGERALYVRNAPSPAATAALALGELIADQAEPGLA